jgi:hypothetical protein
MQKRTLRRKYKLSGGNPAPVPASSSAQQPNTSLDAPPAQPPPNQVIRMSATDGARQNAANRALAGGSCPEGVPHGKIEVPQFKLTGIDGPINANTNMVGLATTYAVAQTNATNDNLVKV